MGARLARGSRDRRLASARVMRIAGICLGLVITVGMAILVGLDRQARLDAAERQSRALATGVDRLLHFELRNVERALRGLLADVDTYADLSAGEAHRRRELALRGVASRHEELAEMAFYAPDAGPGRTDRPAWLDAAGPRAGTLAIGPLQQRAGTWLLPLAMIADDDHAVVALFRTGTFATMVGGLDVGQDGSVAIYAVDGTIITRFGRTGDHTGRRVRLPDALRTQAQFNGPLVSPLDQIERAASFSATSGYPLVVSSGLGLREAMRPWWLYAICAFALCALYWAVLAYVVRRLRNDERARDAMLEEIGTQSDWLQQAQLAAGIGVWRIDAGSTNVRASPELAAMYGLTTRDGLIPLDDFFRRMHPDDAEAVRLAFEAVRNGQGPLQEEYRVVLPDGEIRWLKARGNAIGDGDPPAMTGTVSDITERRLAQQRIERAEAQFRLLFDRNPLPAWVYDTASLQMMAVNDAAIEAYGYSRDAFMALTVTELIPPQSRDTRACHRLGGNAEARQERLWTIVARDGRRIDARVHAREMELQNRPARLMLAEDVGARLAYERDLAWRASHDMTTGMLTLPVLAERLDARCETEGGAGFAVAYVQLRDLELIAPTLGRAAGERVLREAAARFARVADSFGHVAYAPAETFVVIAMDPEQLQAMVQALAEAIAAPVQADGGTFALEAWIGLARGPCASGGAEQVIAHAALAALRARRERVPMLQYDRHMSDDAATRLALVHRLREAVERQAFELVYQPIQRLSDGHVVAVEALIRWPQADGSFISPGEFIPLSEESGLIVPLGAWILEEAARAWRRLAAAGRADIAVAVNVSALQFEAGITRDVMHALRETHGLPRYALHLELTESVLLRDPEAAHGLMAQLHEEGVCLSIDDFGTGFSSMAYLRDLPIDHLKIDRAFVRDVHKDARNAAICRALIALGHGLGLGVIAEGVEEVAQLDWLRAQGCDQAQGYHLGRPQALATLLPQLEAATAP